MTKIRQVHLTTHCDHTAAENCASADPGREVYTVHSLKGRNAANYIAMLISPVVAALSLLLLVPCLHLLLIVIQWAHSA